MAAKRMAFTTAVKNRDTIEFDLDDVTYHFTPGKRSGMTLAVMDADSTEGAAAGLGKGLLDWFSDGLAEGEAERLRDRLLDPKDDFDTEDLSELANAMLGAASGRPPTSRSASSTSPGETGKSSTPEPLKEDLTLLTSPSTDSSGG